MTNEQINCPINEYDEAEKAFQNYETNGSYKDTFIDGYMEGYQFANTLIQLRIDKEKAAAVQEERERKLSDLTDDERMEIFRQYCTSCGCADPKCQCWNDD